MGVFFSLVACTGYMIPGDAPYSARHTSEETRLPPEFLALWLTPLDSKAAMAENKGKYCRNRELRK